MQMEVIELDISVLDMFYCTSKHVLLTSLHILNLHIFVIDTIYGFQMMIWIWSLGSQGLSWAFKQANKKSWRPL